MRQAAIDAWFYMQYWFDNFPKEKLFCQTAITPRCWQMTTTHSVSFTLIALILLTGQLSIFGVPICQKLSAIPRQHNT
jgi:hypothetical protein